MAETKPTYSYTVYIISGGTKYNVTKAVGGLNFAEPKGQIAQRVIVLLKDTQVGNAMLSSIIKARDRVYIYANEGSGEKEVFRGYVWTRSKNTSLREDELRYTCYDNLIYFQESEDSLYFSSGKSTKDVVSSICSKWGIKLQYSYESITHAKLPLRGTLSDIFMSDVLDLVKQRKGKKYVVLSEQDTMHVKPVGSNTTIYHFLAGKNVTRTASGWTMDGVITQVVILGKADKNDREPVEATVSGKTSEYGTLQKIQSRSDNTTLADAKAEAKKTIDENGTPKWEYEITAPDIPWIRKGDKVYVSAGEISGYKIVVDIDRTIEGKRADMTLVMEDL